MLWDLIRTQELLDSRNRLKVKSEPTSFYRLETIGKEVYQWRTLLRAVMRNPNFFHLAANPWGYQLYSHQPSFWASLPSGYNLPSQDFGSFLVVTNLRSPDGSLAFPHRSSRPADGGDWWSVWVFFHEFLEYLSDKNDEDIAFLIFPYYLNVYATTTA